MNLSEEIVVDVNKVGQTPFEVIINKLNGLAVYRIVTVVAILILGFDFFALYRSLSGNIYWESNTDFSVYIRAASAISRGDNLYNPDLYKPFQVFYGAIVHDQYPYPPLFAEILLPFFALGNTAVRYLWLLANLTFFALSFIFLLRKFGHVLAWPWVLLVIAVLGSTNMVRMDLYHGQVNFLLLFLFVVGLWLYLQKRTVAMGIFWGVMFLIKPFLGVFVFYLLWRREWKGALVSLVVSGSLFFLSFLPTLFTGGLAAFTSWLEVSSYYSNAPYAARPDNYSLTGLSLRLFANNPYTDAWVNSLPLATLIRILLVGLVLAFFFLAVPLRTVKQARPVQPTFLLIETGLVAGLGMLYGPLAEGDHLFLLIPAFIGILTLTVLQLTGRWSRANPYWKWAALGWAILYIMLLNPIRSTFGVPSEEAWVPLKGASILLTGQIGFVLFVALGLTVLALRKEARSTSSSEA